jgi:hypothetical protein
VKRSVLWFVFLGTAINLACSSSGGSSGTDGGAKNETGLTCRDGKFYFNGQEFTSCYQCPNYSSCVFESDTFSTSVTAYCNGQRAGLYDGKCQTDDCQPGAACPNPAEQCTRIGQGFLHCQLTGGSGQACRLDQTCGDGLECISGGCFHPGGELQPCAQNETCEGDLVCGFPNGSTCLARTLGVDYGAYDKCCMKRVAEGGTCQGDVCQAGLRCYAPFGTASTTCMRAGGDRQPCLPDGTCNPGARCEANVCVAEGGDKQPCLNAGGCNPGFACTQNALSFCLGTASTCCLPIGKEGDSCGTLVSTQCVAPLVCAMAAGHACARVGGLGEYCRDFMSLANPACDSGLACAKDSKCVTAGGELEPCENMNSCNAGLRCLSCLDNLPWHQEAVCPATHPTDWICRPAGGDGQPCYSNLSSGFMCDAGLKCFRCDAVNVTCPANFNAPRICLVAGG